MRGLRNLILVMVVVAAGTTSRAEDRFGLGVKLGTLGFGLEFTGQVTHWFALRATVNQYDYSKGVEKSGIEYDGTLKVGGYGVLADFYPAKGNFRLTVGALSNRNKVELVALPTSPVDIGDTTYTPDQVGTLTGDMTFKSVVPYFGLGYGNAAKGPHRVGFIFDLGVVGQGSPKIVLNSSAGGVSQSDLDKEAQAIEEDTKDFKLWPVIAFGISFRI